MTDPTQLRSQLDARAYDTARVRLDDSLWSGVPGRASVWAFCDSRAWLGLDCAGLSVHVSAGASAMRKLGEHLIAAADAAEASDPRRIVSHPVRVGTVRDARELAVELGGQLRAPHCTCSTTAALAEAQSAAGGVLYLDQLEGFALVTVSSLAKVKGCTIMVSPCPDDPGDASAWGRRVAELNLSRTAAHEETAA